MVVTMFSSMHYGSRFVTLPKFEPEMFLRALYRIIKIITLAHLVPPLLLFLAKHALVDNCDLSSMEILTGAASAGGEIVKSVKEMIGIEVIRQLRLWTYRDKSRTHMISCLCHMACRNLTPLV